MSKTTGATWTWAPSPARTSRFTVSSDGSLVAADAVQSGVSNRRRSSVPCRRPIPPHTIDDPRTERGQETAWQSTTCSTSTNRANESALGTQQCAWPDRRRRGPAWAPSPVGSGGGPAAAGARMAVNPLCRSGEELRSRPLAGGQGRAALDQIGKATRPFYAGRPAAGQGADRNRQARRRYRDPARAATSIPTSAAWWRQRLPARWSTPNQGKEALAPCSMTTRTGHVSMPAACVSSHWAIAPRRASIPQALPWSMSADPQHRLLTLKLIGPAAPPYTEDKT